MAMFTDTVTIYNKQSDETWARTVVENVQWVDKEDKQNIDGRISIAKYFSVTFPGKSAKQLKLSASNEEDLIVKGVVNDEITTDKGHRVSDMRKKYDKCGMIQSVHDNSDRDYLPNIKVVLS